MYSDEHAFFARELDKCLNRIIEGKRSKEANVRSIGFRHFEKVVFVEVAGPPFGNDPISAIDDTGMLELSSGIEIEDQVA